MAEDDDEGARDLICWAGTELDELANAVIRQLEFENLAFDVVMTGSLFEGSAMLIEPMRETIHKVAPKARFVRVSFPPVIGAVMPGMKAGAISVTPEIRNMMNESTSLLRNVSVR